MCLIHIGMETQADKYLKKDWKSVDYRETGKGLMKAVLPQETQFAIKCSMVKNVTTVILSCLKYSFSLLPLHSPGSSKSL